MILLFKKKFQKSKDLLILGYPTYAGRTSFICTLWVPVQPQFQLSGLSGSDS